MILENKNYAHTWYFSNLNLIVCSTIPMVNPYFISQNIPGRIAVQSRWFRTRHVSSKCLIHAIFTNSVSITVYLPFLVAKNWQGYFWSGSHHWQGARSDETKKEGKKKNWKIEFTVLVFENVKNLSESWFIGTVKVSIKMMVWNSRVREWNNFWERDSRNLKINVIDENNYTNISRTW